MEPDEGGLPKREDKGDKQVSKGIIHRKVRGGKRQGRGMKNYKVWVIMKR